MKVKCEMLVSEIFRLSSGHVAIVGNLNPNIEGLIPNNCGADLYVSGKKVQRINIVGEDRFSGGDETMRKGRRSVRTDSKISKDLSIADGMKLVIFETED